MKNKYIVMYVIMIFNNINGMQMSNTNYGNLQALSEELIIYIATSVDNIINESNDLNDAIININEHLYSFKILNKTFYNLINSEHVKYLIGNKIKESKEILSQYENTLLLINAAKKENIEICKLLIYSGINVNNKNISGDTALIHSVIKGNINIVELLLQNKADVNLQNTHDHTALIYAIALQHKDIVQLLIANGANIDFQYYNDHSALMIAAEIGNEDIIKILLNKGANINLKTKIGDTALLITIGHKHLKIAIMLLLQPLIDFIYKPITKLDNYNFN